MRASISFLTTTAAVVDPSAADGASDGPNILDVLGLHRGQRAVYLLEHFGKDELPLLHVIHLRGEHAGRLVPMRSWYEGDPAELVARFRARLAELRAELEPLEEMHDGPWLLSTRVVQRRALRLAEGGPPIRKFALQLTVEPIDELGEAPPARTVVTAYLRPRAALDGVWAIPGEPLALVRIAYVGVPAGLGHDKHTALVVPRRVH